MSRPSPNDSRALVNSSTTCPNPIRVTSSGAPRTAAIGDGRAADDRRREGEEERRTAPARGRVDVDDGAHGHLEPGLLPGLARGGRTGVLVGVDEAGGQRPQALARPDAALDEQQPAALVVHDDADTDLRLLRFDSAAFRKLLDEMPKASERVLRLLNARLRG